MLIKSNLFKFGYNYKNTKSKITGFHQNVFSNKKCNIYSLKQLRCLDLLKLKINSFLFVKR